MEFQTKERGTPHKTPSVCDWPMAQTCKLTTTHPHTHRNQITKHLESQVESQCIYNLCNTSPRCIHIYTLALRQRLKMTLIDEFHTDSDSQNKVLKINYHTQTTVCPCSVMRTNTYLSVNYKIIIHNLFWTFYTKPVSFFYFPWCRLYSHETGSWKKRS